MTMSAESKPPTRAEFDAALLAMHNAGAQLSKRAAEFHRSRLRAYQTVQRLERNRDVHIGAVAVYEAAFGVMQDIPSQGFTDPVFESVLLALKDVTDLAESCALCHDDPPVVRARIAIADAEASR